MNFKIVNDRLTALAEMTRADFDAIVANTGKTPLVFAKGGKVNAAIRFATEDGIFTTFNNTGIENTKAYKTGDAFVTRLDNNENVARVFEDNPNTYVVDGDKVASLFDIAEGEVVENGENFGRKYAGKNIVEAIPFTGGMEAYELYLG